MTRQVLLVSKERAGAHRTIAQALRHAVDGALIRLAAGTYEEELLITSLVTLAAEAEAGSVRIHAPSEPVDKGVIDTRAAEIVSM